MDIEKFREYLRLTITELEKAISIKMKQLNSLFKEFKKDRSPITLYQIRNDSRDLLTLFIKLNTYNHILDISKAKE